MELCASNFIINSLDRTLFYSNMTVYLCIRQGSKRNDDSVSVEELDWSAERQLNTSGVTLNADLETKTHHQTPMTYGYSHFIHLKNVATEVKIQLLSTLVSLLPQFGSAFFSSKEGSVPVLSTQYSTFVHIMNVKVIGQMDISIEWPNCSFLF